MKKVSDHLEDIPSDYRPLALAVERAMSGDESALPELKKALNTVPGLTEIGDLVKVAEENLVTALAGTDLYVSEAIQRKATGLRTQLAPTTALEELLVGRIVLTYLQVALADRDFLKIDTIDLLTTGVDSRRRRLDSANSRFLRAVKALASIRRLLGQPNRPRASRSGRRSVSVAIEG